MNQQGTMSFWKIFSIFNFGGSQGEREIGHDVVRDKGNAERIAREKTAKTGRQHYAEQVTREQAWEPASSRDKGSKKDGRRPGGLWGKSKGK
jgi:hypothetical protein